MSIVDSPDWSDTQLHQGLPGQWPAGPSNDVQTSAVDAGTLLLNATPSTPVYLFGADVRVSSPHTTCTVQFTRSSLVFAEITCPVGESRTIDLGGYRAEVDVYVKTIEASLAEVTVRISS